LSQLDRKCSPPPLKLPFEDDLDVAATPTAEYKQVTVLFVDVVRSMDLAASLDHGERVGQVSHPLRGLRQRRDHLGRLHQVLQRLLVELAGRAVALAVAWTLADLAGRTSPGRDEVTRLC
jgi:hypothetical protein